MDFLEDEWRHQERFDGALSRRTPPAAPPPPAPADIDPAFRPYLERLFTANWITESPEVQLEFERILEALTQEAMDNPQEVWISFEKHCATGQMRAVERRLRSAGTIGSWERAFFVVKMAKTLGPFEFSEMWVETSVENLDRNVRFGVRSKPDHFQRDRPE